MKIKLQVLCCLHLCHGICIQSLGSYSRGSFRADVQDVIAKLLERDPTKRLGSFAGAEDIKNHPYYNEISWGLLRNTVPPFVPKESGLPPPPEFAQAHFDEF